MEIIIIAAMSKNNVIGKDNALPWKIKADMQRFKELTNGWPCIMGRKTWESLPKKPLPGRLNIIISKTLSKYSIEGASVFSSLPTALDHCKNYQKVFICGGFSIYNEALALADSIELTLIHQQFDGDTFFPKINPAVWKIEKTIEFDEYSFIRYTKAGG